MGEAPDQRLTVAVEYTPLAEKIKPKSFVRNHIGLKLHPSQSALE